MQAVRAEATVQAAGYQKPLSGLKGKKESGKRNEYGVEREKAGKETVRHQPEDLQENPAEEELPLYGRDGQVRPGPNGNREQTYGREEMDDFIRRQLKRLGNIRADIGQLPEEGESLEAYLQRLGPGLFMGIPSDMADWMCEGRPAFLEGMRMIREASHTLTEEKEKGTGSAGMLFGRNDEDLYWVRRMLEQMEESRKKQKEYSRKLSVMQLKKKLNYHMGRDMARLAKVSTDKEVRSLISGVYARRAGILGSSLYGSKEKATAQRQMDYVITCARTKIRQLKEERQVEGRKKRAEKERRLKEYRQLEKELKERRQKRKAAEHARIFERMPDLPGLRDQEERRDALEESLLHVGAESPSLDLQLVDVPAQSGLGASGQVDELAPVTV